ncbi:MAG: bifunctional N-acetylglucosamine-1-phosphate uridyltransferase/glucosamine-1-phosphate acetyltransferase [Planctomycetes bacterium]|nr:bifunctional N-acetylglucosamine-1-phosphate uridyltransferase/glucosamine-1-phosphate acetyltransferase [Planctomycetota bacterium]
MSAMAAVILAAGKGTRMYSERPKVLHEVCGKPMLGYVLQAARGAGVDRVYAVVGCEGDQVKAVFKNESVSWVEQKEQRGTGHALSMTASELAGFDGALLVLCGDIPLITTEILKKLIETHQAAPETAATVMTCVLDDPARYGRIVRDSNGQVQGIIETVEASEAQRKIKEINVGIYVFDSKLIYPLLKELKPHQKNGEYYLTDVIGLLINRGKKVIAYQADDPGICLGVNSQSELVNATRVMRQKVIERLNSQGVTVIDPDNTYIEPTVTIGRDTVIYPFTVIRGKVTIGKNCSVGPFTHLRTGSVLADHARVGNFTELKKTTLGERSKANHLSYLGDSIIGNDVNVGAGTITANYDGKNKHQTRIDNGASTGSGTVLVAPVKLGKNSMTGAGAVVSKGKDVKDGETVVGIPAKAIKKKKSKKRSK